MGRPVGWMKALTGRSPMKSPGAPALRRKVERMFWREIARGCPVRTLRSLSTSQAAGGRWFRERGGMPLFIVAPVTGRYLSFAEREEIAVLNGQGLGSGRSPAGWVVPRRRFRGSCAVTRQPRGGKLEYRASVAQWKADLLAQQPKASKLVTNDRLREYVQARLAGQVRRLDGTLVPGPLAPSWSGRNKPRRQDRRWVTAWSPQQISHRLRIDFPDDEAMRISHEAIYQALFIQGRGALKRELVACLRTGRALRVPHARARQRRDGMVSPEVMISQRPAEAGDGAVPGHWEGDLIIGLDRSAIGTLVERTTRYTMLLHLPRMNDYGVQPRVKNGPALAGHGARAVRD